MVLRTQARRRAAAALKRSEIRYRRLFEAANEGIILVDPDTQRIVDVNPFMVRLLGYAREELLGKQLWQIGLLKDEEACKKALRELQEQGFIRYEDLPLQTKEGQHREVDFVSNVYRENGHRIIQCDIRDITERERTEKALREAQAELACYAGGLEKQVAARTAELEASAKQLETFVYSIAHDLRGPLRAMQGFSQMLVQRYGPVMNEIGREYAERISDSAQFMDRLIVDLLDFSRISQQAIDLGPVNLETAVNSALSRHENEIQEKNAHVEVFSPLATVLAHEPTLGQVLANLISNALKFVDPGLQPHIRIRAEERAAIVRISVEDNGIGIPVEQQERIFQVFQRLHTTTYPGTGIGLAIVHKGVERMKGRVGVESTPGQGSRFWIELAKA
ncbi:MAG: ATP-binding protein [Verrucomicrobia subdivision 3 bacterium]|nr:ATP-binding protein [Limisphaerales bacterium]